MAKKISERCFILAIDNYSVTQLIEIEQKVFIYISHIAPLRYEFFKECKFKCLSCEKYSCCANERKIALSCHRGLSFEKDQYDMCFLLSETMNNVSISDNQDRLLSHCDIVRDERECGVCNGTPCYEKEDRVLSIQLADIVKIEPEKIDV